MYKLLNFFLRSNFFDKLPRFVTRKIFKIFKIFFVETDLNELPINNHSANIDKAYQQRSVLQNNDEFYKPFNTCPYLLEILAIYNSVNSGIKILDFGANNIDNYIYLNKHLKKFEYNYYDLPEHNNFILNLQKENKWDNIKVINDLYSIDNNIDFAFFGSSIHYVSDYKKKLDIIIKKNPKYFIFSHTPFFTSNKNNKDIVVKQVNIHPTINYAYLLEYNNFIKFMEKNNYKLITKNKNNFIKFLNFKNFSNFSFLSFLDLIFIKNY
jgi:putative methyltransferase (TIGR04325 family)